MNIILEIQHNRKKSETIYFTDEYFKIHRIAFIETLNRYVIISLLKNYLMST